MGYKFYKAENDININGFYTAFESYYTNNYQFNGESHDFWEVMYIKKGRVSVTADERIYELNEGDIIFHKPNEFHKFIKLGDDAFSFFVMSFSADGAGMQYFENRVFSLNREQKYAMTNLIDYLREREDVYKNVETISYLAGDVSVEFISILKNMTELFLMHDIKNHAKPKPSLSATEAVVFREAVIFMHKNIYQNLSAEEIANNCNVSLSYIKKIFSKHTGKGVHEYFLRLKIIEATKLLKEEKTVAEVSNILSFSSQNYFSTVYKRITGVSPNKFKTQS